MVDAPSVQGKWTRTALFSLAAVGLNQVIRFSLPVAPAMLGLLIVCIATLWTTLGRPTWSRLQPVAGFSPPALILTVGLALQFAEILYGALRAFRDSPERLAAALFIAGILASAFVTLLALVGWAPPGNIWFALLVILHFASGVASLQAAAPPEIDVYEFQQRASAALLSGHNPYTVVYPNIYGNGTPFYSPAVYENDRMLFGFPYPPLSLLMSLPSFLLTGDVRYAHLAAIGLSALLIGLASKGLLSKLAALTFLFSPVTFLIVQKSWIEPFVILLTGAVMFPRKTDRWCPLPLGVLMASKQFALLAAPAAFFLIPRPSLRSYAGLLARSGAVVMALMLPFAVWDVRAFYRSVVLYQFLQPFRIDALTFPAWLVRLGAPQPPVWLAFVAVATAGFFLFRRLQPSAFSFVASLAVMYLLFFCWNKQAFANYYFLVEACLCWAIVTLTREDDHPTNKSAGRFGLVGRI
jgi:hypothetical protein